MNQHEMVIPDSATTNIWNAAARGVTQRPQHDHRRTPSRIPMLLLLIRAAIALIRAHAVLHRLAVTR